MKKGYLFAFLLLLSQTSLAQDFNGSFTQNGSEDTYTVNIQNDLGHVYTGTASETRNGKMIVNVDDGAGEAYTGLAQDDGYDGLDLFLKNPKTGETATGNVDRDEY